MTEIVAADIGGTHARFALATIGAGRVLHIGEPVTLQTSAYPSLAESWRAFAASLGRPLPPAAGIAVACPLGGEVLTFTNSPWVIRPSTLAVELGLEFVHLVNDFGAMGHAIGELAPDHFQHLAGPDVPLPAQGVITIIGPGTGLGAAQVLRRGGQAHVIETEGGHMDFAPADAVEDAILHQLRARFGRVSLERVAAGPGLVNIYEALSVIEGRAVETIDDKALWARAQAGEDAPARDALARFCMILGAAAGDLALAQGAAGVVLTGGVAPRIAGVLKNSGFAARFAAKGRLKSRMTDIPVKLLTHPNPGLLGAAAAFAARERK